MPRRGRPTTEITLSPTSVGRSRDGRAGTPRPRRWLFDAASCSPAPRVARTQRSPLISVSTGHGVEWRHRFGADRLDGLMDAPRPGAARTIGDEVDRGGRCRDSRDRTAGRHALVDAEPRGQTRDQPSDRVGDLAGLRPQALAPRQLQGVPRPTTSWRRSVTSSALYMNPPVAAVVFAVDEKPQIQALNRTAPTLPMLPTTPERATHDYERNGTCDLFAALNMATGTVITDIRSTHTSADFVAFLNKVNRDVPDGLDVHVILD